MKRVERLLLHCSSGTVSGQHTVRQIIGFKTQSNYKRCIKELSRHGIKPVKSIRQSRVISCLLDGRRTEQLQSLKNHPHVKYVEPDLKISSHGLSPAFIAPPSAAKAKRTNSRPLHCTAATSTYNRASRPLLLPPIFSNSATISKEITWNINRIQAPDVWASTCGEGVGIAIIDTGIASHPDLQIAGGVNTIDGSSYQDDNGHGTHVAGTAAALGTNGNIAGTAPKASLYAVKALDADGAGYVSDIIAGIDWCIKKKIKVINMSLGLQNATSAALRDAVQRAYKQGIVIVASAGNSGPNSGTIDEPASYSETIAVAASTIANGIADFSSRGSGIDIAAPGSIIRSTWLKNGYQVLSGTSMACPHAAGSAALILAKEPNLTPAQVAERLRSSALTLPGYVAQSQGSGLLQIADAMSKKNTNAAARRKRILQRRAGSRR
ncbi:S8 family peptidase [Paenibacillus oenotherae]|uniref:S8 family peptidase n=1 Tax=Paenibacillus oenotherae TaxID=1435645 RepID=A0ABS7D0Z3_9BACL|nr:S8 family peptidase [Paenibacillus oenotherae]MBW7473521.1 S8 family peptidase [Paenibacillus oenotherae]